jgi:poly(3-hydroxybutyrate) depolymerase
MRLRARPATDVLDANAEIWRFFSRHARPGPI